MVSEKKDHTVTEMSSTDLLPGPSKPYSYPECSSSETSNHPSCHQYTTQSSYPGPQPSILHRYPRTDTDLETAITKFHIPNENIVKKIQRAFLMFTNKYWDTIRRIMLSILFIAYTVYFAFAIRHDMKGAMALIVITSLVSGYLVYDWVKIHFGHTISRALCEPLGIWWDKHWHVIKWFIYPGIIIGIVLYLAIDVIKTTRQFQSLFGLVLFFVIPWITCKHPNHIQWRPVMWGMFLQFLIGCLVLRWKAGYNAIEFLAQQFNAFLGYSIQGGAKIFGDPVFIFHPFAMIIMPLIVYLGCMMGILYYWGVIPWIAEKVGWLMSVSLNTTAIESVSLVVNIFLSVLDAILMLKEYMSRLTPSEFHCFLVAAHSTIAGFAFGLFVFFGVSPQHLMTGAVISAPAAVALSKLNFPETEKSFYSSIKYIRLPPGEDLNFIDAGIRGGWAAAVSVATIFAQVISFIGMYSFLNIAVMWCFARVGIELDIATLVGYIFIPFSYLMGVDWEDAGAVGRLLGLKVTANEFLSFLELGGMISDNSISPRSAAIATYAMCGFSSFGTLAIFAGVWNAVDRKRTAQVMRQIPRLMMNSNLSCFMTACIVSILYTEDIEQKTEINPLAGLLEWVLDFIPKFDSIKESLTDVVQYPG